jgi:hypothetical protein
MSFILSTLGFVVSAAMLGVTAPYSDGLVGLVIWPFCMLGVYVALIMVLRRYFYTATLFAFHVFFAAFLCYIYLNRHEVVREKQFNFSVFTDGNLQLSIWVLCAATLAVLVPWLLLAARTVTLSRLSVRAVAAETIGRLDTIGPFWVILLLTGSFLCAVFLFLTNPSVLDIPYPLQFEGHWEPYEALKVPTFMSAVALAIVYAKRIARTHQENLTVNIARANFLFSNILLLLLTGSRGVFTFLWLLVGLFELFLWWRRKGSLSWSLIFVFMAWFAFQCWPYMRFYLSLLPFDEVASESLLIFFGVHSSSAAAYGEGIRIGDFTMISGSLFHLLDVVQLIRDGISLHGSTFVNLFPQFLPSWLDGVFWDRPISDGWVLGNYYSHGGGFLLIANAYWNGGTWVAVLFMSILSAIFVGYDRYLADPRAGTIYRVFYWLWMPAMIVQLCYGLEGMARVIELLAAGIILEYLLARRSAGLRPQLSGM